MNLWYIFSLSITRWEIVSYSNCDLESQLGFLIEKGKINLSFFIMEENIIPWCGRKVCLFLIKEVMYF